MQFIKLILTAFLSVLTLFVTAKIMGHKQISQLDFFDYISGITIGSIAAELATELEKPWKPLIAIIVFGGVSVLLSFLTQKFPRTRKFINGTPTIIMNGGKLYRENLKKTKLDLSEFLVLCRQQGYFDINDIETAVFEFNGKLSILPVSTARPATPKDMNIYTAPSQFLTEVIMDGRILHNNLKRLGLSREWLEKELKLQSYNSTKQIFLALCDNNNKLSVFPVK